MAIQDNNTKLERLGWCLNELFYALESIDRLAIEIVDAGCSEHSVEEVAKLAGDIQRIARYSGLMVETEATRIDAETPIKGYEGWIIPPVHRQQSEHPNSNVTS